MSLLLKLHLILAALFIFQLKAKANIDVFELESKKPIVKLSLWYEGVGQYNNSLFNQERQGEIVQQLLDENDTDKAALSSELVSALKHLNY